MRTLLIISFPLLILSAPPLFLMGREKVIDSTVRERYSVEGILSEEKGVYGTALRGEIGTHHLQLVDDRPVLPHEPFKLDDDRAPGMVSILVDGQAVSTPVAATVRLEMKDANRYWGFAYLMKLKDRQGPDSLVVAQNLGHEHYRTVSLFADGRVVTDEFGYEGRCSPPVRSLLIRYVVPHPSGYCSDALTMWPTVIYPLLYPWLSGAFGLVGVGVAAGLRLRERQRRDPK